MVSVSHLDDHALEELQNATYLERLQRMEKIRRAGDSAPCETAPIHDRAMRSISGASMRLADEANTQGPTTKPPTRSFAPPRSIGWAIKQLHNGARVTRAGWNGRGQCLALQVPDDRSFMTLPYLYIRTVQGDRVPWLASQTDLLATDWQLAS